MKEYKGGLKSYSVEELSDSARENAHQNYINDLCDDFYLFVEIEDTLREFCRIFDVECYNWEYNSYSHRFSFRVLIDDDQNNLSGIRLAKFMWNNYARYIEKGKFYYTTGKYVDGKYTYKHRYSKSTMEMDSCPLTGGCFDCSVLEPIIKCLTYKETYNSYEELIEDCLEGLFQDAEDSWAGEESEEYFLDHAIANGYEYDEDGNDFIPELDFVFGQ